MAVLQFAMYVAPKNGVVMVVCEVVAWPLALVQSAQVVAAVPVEMRLAAPVSTAARVPSRPTTLMVRVRMTYSRRLNTIRPLDSGSLMQAVAAGATFQFRPFYGHTPRADGALSDAVFSQWYALAPFPHEGTRYFTAEQFMMAAKARLFEDHETLASILVEPDPGKVKALGREVRGYDDARWAAARFDAVTTGSVAKFSSTPELRAYLLATGDEVLVEAAPRDCIWGIGLGRQNALVSQPAKWRGLNLLGFALMRARERLR